MSVDSELCIGCESCIKACPYEGVRTLIKSPEYYLDVVVGEYDAPPHKGGTVEKCTFCKNLIDRGDVPACMQLCPGRARYWGDLDDPSRTCRRPSRDVRRCSSTRKPARNRAYTTCSNKALTA